MSFGNKHYHLVGISAGHAGPVASPAHISLDTGVHAFYGRNGVGKSWVLRLIEAALTGTSPGHETPSIGHTNGAPFAHLHLKINPNEDPFANPVHAALFTAVDRALAAIRGDALITAEDPYDVYDEDEDGLESASLQSLLRSYVRALVRRMGLSEDAHRLLHEAVDQCRFTLAASSALSDSPRWRVWLSRSISDRERDLIHSASTADLAPFLMEIAGVHPIALNLLLDYLGLAPQAEQRIFLPPWMHIPLIDLGFEIEIPVANVIGGANEATWTQASRNFTAIGDIVSRPGEEASLALPDSECVEVLCEAAGVDE
ncbi:ATP-binding protein [Gordonia alkanivorans]|uniref:ATP-binding protein n=1 Tax=Gordonia alkanivorans TaxID=84096 RepID=UPI0012DFA4D2|nr:ATP-binding protein [Gordonia alkanivorans]